MTPDELMRRAIALSQLGMEAGAGGPFGAVIARDGVIIGEGWNQVTSANDSTAHAEIVAIRRACSALATHDLSGCDMFTSCEPCPMCLGAIYWARVKKIWFGNDRRDAAAIGFDDDFLYRELPKPLAERAIPTEQLLGAEAAGPFRAWTEKADKIAY